ncbi:MAG: ROK family protein [Rhodospirillaceae bacterium]
MSNRIGIDLGGTKIEAVALAKDGAERFRQRVATPAGDYEATIRAIAGLVRAADTALGENASVGVGIPGAISPATGLVKNANSTCLIGRALDKDIAAAVGRPVRLGNDADCFALSEAVDGAAANTSIVFGVILGTGVGGGLVIDRRPVSGPNAITGEWGHNPLPWPKDEERPGPKCYCGRTGCIETFLSGPGLARDHGQGWTAERIAASGDPGARAAMDRYVERLARGLAHVVNIIDPHVIVLGGGLSRVGRLYEDVPRLWSAGVFSDAIATKLVPPRYGDSSGVRGAAWLWS